MTKPPNAEGCAAAPRAGARSAFHARNLAAVLVIAFFAFAFAYQHVVDNRVFYSDCAITLNAALRLVDDGEFIPHGNPSFNFHSHDYDLHLGPFANLLMSLPLLVSRDFTLQYAFVSLLNALALIVIAHAAGRALRGSGLDWTAPLLLGSTILLDYPVVMPINTFYQPFFLAVFVWMLVMDAGGKRWALVGAWATAAVCMQLHFTNVLLAPVLLAATPWRRGREAAWSTAAGVGLVLLSQGYFVNEVFTAWRSGYMTGEMGARHAFGWSTFWETHQALFEDADAIYSHALLVLTAVGLFRLPALFKTHARLQRLTIACLLFAVLEVEFSSFFNLVAHGGTMLLRHYFFATNVFLAFWGALATDVPAGSGMRNIAASTLVRVALGGWCLATGVHAVSQPLSDGYYDYYRLNDQLVMTDRLRAIARDNDLWGFRIRELAFDADGQAATCDARSESDTTYGALMEYVAPEEAVRLDPAGARELIVTVFAKSVPDTSDRLPIFQGRELRELGAIETGHFSASFRYGEGIPSCYND